MFDDHASDKLKEVGVIELVEGPAFTLELTDSGDVVVHIVHPDDEEWVFKDQGLAKGTDTVMRAAIIISVIGKATFDQAVPSLVAAAERTLLSAVRDRSLFKRAKGSDEGVLAGTVGGVTCGKG